MKIYNSLSRKKEEFVPLKEGRAGIYVCGPTVYDEPHIGHARSAYIFDVIRRYLQYRNFKVTFVRNVTDVDDKIIEKARISAKGKGQAATTLKEETQGISKKYLAAYHEDMALLGISRPDKEPKATEYIPKMIKFIGLLIKKGCAYEALGDVYFDIKKARDYGKLSNQNLDKMEAGARISSGENKKDPLDFALWKRAKEDEPSWDSPWGKGRPGWHIECSVMSSDILGDEFDIHGGGIDLIFPHHENEMAQSELAGRRFARYWIHNGLLTIKGEKMAKSLGNFISIKDFLAKHKDADYLKLLFLSTHYRHPVDYTEEKISEMKAEKERIRIFLKGANENLEKFERTYDVGQKMDFSKGPGEALSDLGAYDKNFKKAMEDDFNFPSAIAELFNAIRYANSLEFEFGKKKDSKTRDAAACAILRHARDTISDYLINIFGLFQKYGDGKDALSTVEKALFDERQDARRRKDYKKSDEFRQVLFKKHGIILEDTEEGTAWRRKG